MARAADRLVGAGRIQLDEHPASARPARAAAQERRQRAAVQAAAIARRLAGPDRIAEPAGIGEQRGRHVLVRDDGMDPRRQGAVAVGPRHPDGKGNVEGRLVDRALAVRLAVLAEEVAVVGEVEDDGAAKLSLAPQLRDHLADAVVQRRGSGQAAVPDVPDPSDRVGVEPGEAPDGLGLVRHVFLVERGWARQGEVVHLPKGPPIGRERRRHGAAWWERRFHAVGRVVGQPEEEGTAPARAAVKKPSRLAGEHVRRVVTALVAVAHAAPPVADLIVVVARVLDELKPSVESRSRADSRHVVVPIQVLADEPGAVPRPVEPDRKRVSRIEQIRVSRWLENTPWLCGYCPVRTPARAGQHRGGAAMPSVKRVPGATIPRNVRGMYLRLKVFSAWSSAMMTRKLGGL